MTRQRARTLLLLLVLSLLLAPWVHSMIKPYRLRLDMLYRHEIPTPVYVYHSNRKNTPTDFKDTQVEEMHIVGNQEAPPPLALVRGIVRSTRPVSGLRIDPATTPNQIQMGALTLHTLTGVHTLTVQELEPHVKAGNDITNVRIENGVLRFDTVGNDPNFLVPLPPEVLKVPQRVVNLNYLLAWFVSASMVVFLAVVIRKHHLGFTGRFRRPLALLDGSTARSAWTGLALDIAAGVVLIYMLLEFIQLYTHFDLSPITQTFARDGVGKAVPIEVREMKTLVQRHGDHAFVLAGDMGKGDDESEVFQRATEYLYPSRIVHQSEWVFGRVDVPLEPRFGECQPVDKTPNIVLYACRP
ncbi:hypothetical protein [Hydrogenophaga sp. RWCD_12]|uniref:hypothetical protein n=1 Tax=Hydrogenophaga sp. RWCD_12 TaxID=3391190 RepID=UPI0039854A31